MIKNEEKKNKTTNLTKKRLNAKLT